MTLLFVVALVLFLAGVAFATTGFVVTGLAVFFFGLLVLATAT